MESLQTAPASRSGVRNTADEENQMTVEIYDHHVPGNNCAASNHRIPADNLRPSKTEKP
jgi:hypothetical protein